MEWMTVRVFSKSLGHFRPVALAITTQQFEFARFKNYQTEEGVQGTCMKSSWHAIGTKGTRRGVWMHGVPRVLLVCLGTAH